MRRAKIKEGSYMGFFDKIKAGLSKTRDALSSTLGSVFSGFSEIDDDFYDELEESLILADLGVDTAVKAVDRLRKSVREQHLKTPEEARTHPRKNLITRALGAEERIRADLYEKELRSGDFLLLCSDGLSNILSDQELLYEVIHGGEPADCCQRLVNITISRGAPDNVTAVLFQIL